MAGVALAARVSARFPSAADGSEAKAESDRAPAVDVDAFMRGLRRDAEALLTAGQIEVAEALMEERRLELADQGVVFRRINQAFFAARGIYATSPGSVDPTGQQLRPRLEHAGGVGAFLRSSAAVKRVATLREVPDTGGLWAAGGAGSGLGVDV